MPPIRLDKTFADRVARTAVVLLILSIPFSALLLAIVVRVGDWVGAGHRDPGLFPLIALLPSAAVAAAGLGAIVLGARWLRLRVLLLGLLALVFGVIQFVVVGGILGLASIS